MIDYLNLMKKIKYINDRLFKPDEKNQIYQ